MPTPSHFDFLWRRHVFLRVTASTIAETRVTIEIDTPSPRHSLLLCRMYHMAYLTFRNPAAPEDCRFQPKVKTDRYAI
jgi:hypothetical protein